MKIAHVDEAILVIRDRPWLIVLFLWAVGLAALRAALTGDLEANGAPLWTVQLLVGALGLGACGLAWIAFPFQHIVFDRAGGVVMHHVFRLFARQATALPLNDIIAARVEKYWGESAWMERVALETRQGCHALEWGYSGTPRGAIVDTINRWLGHA